MKSRHVRHQREIEGKAGIIINVAEIIDVMGRLAPSGRGPTSAGWRQRRHHHRRVTRHSTL